MEASDSRMGSYAWKSILVGREVIKRRSRWRIGNGEKVNIWQHRWLPRKHPPYLPTCPIEDYEFSTVSCLIDPSTRQWYTDLVDGLFVEEDAELIKKIPLSKKVTEDVLYWPWSSNGVYSCKSGYRFLKEEAEQLDTHRVPPLRDKKLWRAVWAMRVPQKMKNFIWRACHDAIPTKQALVKRTIITDPFCDRCRTETESSLHALWSCSEVDIVWADLSLWNFRNHVEFGDLKQLVSWIAAEGKHVELFVFTAWSIWQQRNQVRVRAAATALHQVAEVARNALAEYHSRIAETEIEIEPRSHCLQKKWRPPPVNVAKINFDGAMFSKENKSGIGVVVKNEQGLVLGSCSKRLLQAYSATEIEAMAATTALAFASELGVRRAVLEGDSLAVIKALRECDYPFTPSGLLLEDISLFSHSFDTLLYSHTKREGNSVAHNLAKYAISIPDFLVWMENVPPHIQHFVQADLACFSS